MLPSSSPHQPEPAPSRARSFRLASGVLAVLLATILLGPGALAPVAGQGEAANEDGEPLAIPGTVTISLVSDPPNADVTLPFFIQGYSSAFSYSYSDGRDMRPGDVWALGNLSPGSYAVITPRTIPEHKILSVDCSEADLARGSTGDAGRRSARIGLDPGDDVHCVFTVAGPGELHISVKTDPPGGNPAGDDASLEFIIQGPIGGPSATVAVGETWESEKLPANRYLAQVIDTQPKWKLVAVECEETRTETASTGDVAGRAAIVGIDGGDVVKCTFTIGEPGDVNITLASDPDSRDPAMPFFFEGGSDPGVFQNSELQAPWTWKLEEIPVGRYVAHTTLTDGLLTWKLLDVGCKEQDAKTPSRGDVGSGAARVGVDPAEVVDCTFTVGGPGTVRVAVDTDLPGADGSLSFYVEGRNQRIRPSKTVKVGRPWKIERLPSDQYVSVALPDDGPGRELVRVDCVEVDTTTTSSGSTVTRTGRHGLDPGDDVTCTFVIAGLPKAGRWKAKNHAGRFRCGGILDLPVTASTDFGRITIKDGGKRFVARGTMPGTGKPVTFDQDPNDPHRYVGTVTFRAPQGRASFTITLDVVSATKMRGVLKATVKAEGQTCTIKRKQTLTYAGRS